MKESKNKLNILGIIPARGGSKSIPRKNITKINGHPLIAYTIAEALKSKLITHLIVSSDDDEIRAISEQYGCSAPFRRPKYLSNDKAKSVDCDLHATRYMEKKLKIKFDFVIELMCTNPFKISRDIDSVLKLQIKTNADSVIGVVKLYDHHPLRIKKIVKGRIENFVSNLREVPESRRQDLKPDAYIRNGSIYSMRRDMLEIGIRHGSKNSLAYIMPKERTVNIDEKLDLIMAKEMMKQKPRAHVRPILSLKNAKRKIKNNKYSQ